MRKKAYLLILFAALVLTAGCSSEQLTETLSNIDKPTPASAETPAPTETPAPEQPVLSLGEKTTIGDWEVNVKSVSVKQKIKNGKYQYFKPGKGNTFLVVSMSSKNKGKKAAQFLPRFGMKDKTTVATLYYQTEYEYNPTELMGYKKDLTTKSIQPLTKESGIVVFEIPKKTAKSKKELTLGFQVGDESITYSLK